MRARKIGIELWQVGHPLGECDLHEHIDAWCDPEIPLKRRWKLMHRPNGMPPMEIFHLENQHYGLRTAIFHFITIHLRCLFPNIWIKYKNKTISKNTYLKTMKWKECKSLISSDLSRLASINKWGGKNLLFNASFRITFWFRIGSYLITKHHFIAKFCLIFVQLIHKHNQYLTGIQIGLVPKLVKH